jgi:hypothetical protein
MKFANVYSGLRQEGKFLTKSHLHQCGHTTGLQFLSTKRTREVGVLFQQRHRHAWTAEQICERHSGRSGAVVDMTEVRFELLEQVLVEFARELRNFCPWSLGTQWTSFCGSRER